MDILGSLLLLGGIALIGGGIVAGVANRARPAAGRDLQLEPRAIIVDGISFENRSHSAAA